MANERVSTLVEIFANDLQSQDLFLLTDMTVRESKKLELGQLLLFIESSGSFLAYDSAHATSASYVPASGIGGTIPYATNSSHSLYSDYSYNTLTASFALTAAFALTSTPSPTASYLQYSGFPNGTSSYSLNSATANTANQATLAYNLSYTGVPNGTASYALNSGTANSSTLSSTASLALLAKTSSFALYAPTASYAILANTASYVANTFGPQFLSFPTVLSGSGGTANWLTTPSLTNYGVGVNATAAILELFLYTGQGPIYMFFRNNTASFNVLTSSVGALGGDDSSYIIHQQIVPLYQSTFQFKIVENATFAGCYIKVTGYY